MNTDFRLIVDTRNQLHWACQLLSAAADAALDKAEDDSHSNLGWDAEKDQLVGRADCSILVKEFRLESGSRSFPLTGETLAAAKNWLADSLGSELRLRDYDMPEHPVAVDQPFSPEPLHLQSISEWFTFAQNMLSEFGSLRVWPHHFDLGFWNPGTTKGNSIGGGFSLGDNHYDQPYFYINPYGVKKPATLVELAVGGWSDYWFGAVLLAEEICSGDDFSRVASAFVHSAMNECKMLTQ